MAEDCPCIFNTVWMNVSSVTKLNASMHPCSNLASRQRDLHVIVLNDVTQSLTNSSTFNFQTKRRLHHVVLFLIITMLFSFFFCCCCGRDKEVYIADVSFIRWDGCEFSNDL